MKEGRKPKLNIIEVKDLMVDFGNVWAIFFS